MMWQLSMRPPVAKARRESDAITAVRQAISVGIKIGVISVSVHAGGEDVRQI